MKRLKCCLAAAILTASTHTSAVTVALAAKPPATVPVGASFDILMNISGLDAGNPPGVGAFDISVGYDVSLFTFQTATFGTGLDVTGLGDIQTVTPGADRISLAELSLDTPADVVAHQSNGFTLATLTFQTLAQGTGSFAPVLNSLADASGNSLPVDLLGISVTVSAVPEPAAWLMLPVGLLLIAASRRRVICS